ncbi:ATP-dependent helicase C-terminal domain-containing protein [Cyanobium sp. ATX-6F1]|uniref:ATP-dependent helicase C-terminal domain-containing protein n=1 Tax=Cyanobium sp. ATX-6F1 TaxID=3137388 RepID=UPI0039BE0742
MLTAPAGRPAAITQDLAGFSAEQLPGGAQGAAGRYPKHPWPEDPRQAQATALTKARLQEGKRWRWGSKWPNPKWCKPSQIPSHPGSGPRRCRANGGPPPATLARHCPPSPRPDRFRTWPGH